MRVFDLKPSLYKFNSFSDFNKTFHLSENDLLIASRSVFINHIKNLELPSDLIFPSDYSKGEPTDVIIDKILLDIGKKHYKRIVAVGGGTVLDIAKILALKDIKHTSEIFENEKKLESDKTLILIPTTCGSGSEVTSYSVIKITKNGLKVTIESDALYADYAVLIPELLKGLPFKYFMTSSMDALIHASEAFISPNSNSYTDLYSQNALEILLTGYIKLIERGSNYYNSLLEDYLLASNYAGIAFEMTALGAVHALSYTLGGKYEIPHGEANYTFFTEMFKKYTRENPSGKIKYFNNIVSDIFNIKNDSNLYNDFQDALTEIIPKKPASSYGMTYSEIDTFSKSVLDGQQSLLSNSYVPLSYKDILDIYKNIY